MKQVELTNVLKNGYPIKAYTVYVAATSMFNGGVEIEDAVRDQLVQEPETFENLFDGVEGLPEGVSRFFEEIGVDNLVEHMTFSNVRRSNEYVDDINTLAYLVDITFDLAGLVLDNVEHREEDGKVVPCNNERKIWEQYLRSSLEFLATERPEFMPRKNDTLEDMCESYLSWAKTYNDGYFGERDEYEENRYDRYSRWLVEEYDRLYA